MKTLKQISLPILAAAATLFAADATPQDQQHSHATHGSTAAPSRLVELVRLATQQFLDVNVATSANYQPAFGCVSGPDHGAMGIHYVNGTLVGDGIIDSSKPEALIYQPVEGGLKLVGGEYIVDAAAWNATPTALTRRFSKAKLSS